MNRVALLACMVVVTLVLRRLPTAFCFPPRSANSIGRSSAETMQLGSDVYAANEDIGSRVRWQDLGGDVVRSTSPKCLYGRVRKSFFKGLRR